MLTGSTVQPGLNRPVPSGIRPTELASERSSAASAVHFGWPSLVPECACLASCATEATEITPGTCCICQANWSTCAMTALSEQPSFGGSETTVSTVRPRSEMRADQGAAGLCG